MLTTHIRETIEAQLGTAINSVQPCSGGDINQAFELALADGSRLFAKTNNHVPKDFFKCEANGLAALRTATRQHTALTIPEVILCGDDYLVLNWVQPGRPNKNYNRTLAEGLAQMHGAAQSHFGFIENNYCGSTPQRNTQTDNGHDFFAQHRLLAQAELAQSNGHFTSAEVKKVEQLCNKLPELIPEQQPALVHGDLWGGNAIANEQGEPVLIDPACYWGWPESDLAMMQLFGGFNSEVFDIYQQLRPLEPGLQHRIPIYNLYHTLNHLNLFGGGYYSQVMDILSQNT